MYCTALATVTHTENKLRDDVHSHVLHVLRLRVNQPVHPHGPAAYGDFVDVEGVAHRDLQAHVV